MEQLTAAIDEARAQNVHRDQQQTETLEKITIELQEQTALANVAEEDLAQVNESFEILLTHGLIFFSFSKYIIQNKILLLQISVTFYWYINTTFFQGLPPILCGCYPCP